MTTTSIRRLAAAPFALACALGAHAAAGAPPSWPQPAFDAKQSWNNVAETMLSATNVGQLQLVSTLQPGFFQAGPTTQSHGTLYLCSDAAGLAAIDQASGATRWSRFDFGGGNCQAAVVGNAAVYATAVGYDDGQWTNTLTDVRPADGATTWQVAGPADPGFPAPSWLGFNLPTQWDGGLVVSHGRSLVSAYDAATGALRWRVETGQLNNAVAIAAGRVFTSTWGEPGDDGLNHLFAHDATTGALLWSRPVDGTASEFPATVAGRRVFVGSDSGSVHAFDAASGTPLWTQTFAGYVSAPPVASDKTLIVTTGLTQISAIWQVTGSKQWARRLPAGETVASNLVLANGVLYFTTLDFRGDQHLVAIDATTGARLLRVADPIFGSHADVAVAGGRVDVTSEGRLLVYALP